MARNDKRYSISGINPVTTLLERDPGRCTLVHLMRSNKPNQRLQRIEQLAKQHRVAVSWHDKTFFQSRFSGAHQGVAAEVVAAPAFKEDQLNGFLQRLPHPPLLLILDQIQDPHNFGAILRTADAAGVDAVIIPANNSAPLSDIVSKTAAGAAETTTLFKVGNLGRVMDALKQAGVWLVGTTDHASNTIYQQDLQGPIALVMGSEGDGMRKLTEQKCDFLVKLPMRGVVPSLNVSVATGICLYEITRQRDNASV